MISSQYSNATIGRPLLQLLSSLRPLMLISDNLFRVSQIVTKQGRFYMIHIYES